MIQNIVRVLLKWNIFTQLQFRGKKIVLFTPYNFFIYLLLKYFDSWHNLNMFLSTFYSSVYCPNKAFLLTFHIVLIRFLAKHVFR